MTEQKKDGGPAWPLQDLYHPTTGEPMVQGHSGLSLRDWFAGQAITGMAQQMLLRGDEASAFASRAYEIADAMLEERDK